MISHRDLDSYTSVRVIFGGVTIYVSQFKERERNFEAAVNAVASVFGYNPSVIKGYIKEDNGIVEVDYFTS